MGLRVQAESGADGVFQILIDNNNLGRGGHRKPTGLFRLYTNAPASALPLHVTLRQRLYDGVLLANVSDHAGEAVCSFTAFVNAADIALPVAVVQIQGSATATPSLEWMASGGGNSAYGWKNETVGAESTLYASVLTTTAAAASAAAAAAATKGRAALLQAHTAWWAAYWPQSFLSFEPTRAEGFYYTQMCVCHNCVISRVSQTPDRVSCTV